MLRHVPSRACSAIRSRRSARTVSAMWARIRARGGVIQIEWRESVVDPVTQAPRLGQCQETGGRIRYPIHPRPQLQHKAGAEPEPRTPETRLTLTVRRWHPPRVSGPRGTIETRRRCSSGSSARAETPPCSEDWRARAKMLRQHGGKTLATVLEACAVESRSSPAPKRRYDPQADRGS